MRRASRDVRFVPFLKGRQHREYLRRGLSVAVLVGIDVASAFLGLYAVLAFKLWVTGQPVDSGAIWLVEQKALPIVTITLVLVFAKNHLYRERGERGGSARVLSSMTIATVIVLALVLASGWQFQTYYIFYSSWFTISVLVIVLRALLSEPGAPTSTSARPSPLTSPAPATEKPAWLVATAPSSCRLA